ncbi:substrate-binding periplasmic protein [Dongshaea marina]|uniref:substrate-binding periplasmic protein n=1 Tax=Dongshaea marina TaxID=2047966 RepID=UPI00131EF949|nr:transporter substrate-binding domain-containing protein [Dongshaea marina]
MSWVLALIFCLFTFSAFTSPVKTVSMVTTDWAPYFGSELDEGGVITVLVKTAFEKSGRKSEVRYVPWKRAVKEAEAGVSDILMGAYYTRERDKIFIYSHPFYEIKVGLIALRSLGVTHYRKLEDLTKYTIGVNRGFANSELFDRAAYLQKEVASNQILNVRKLFKHRVDMIVMSHGVFNYEKSKMPKKMIEPTVFVEPLLDRKPLYLIASKSNPQSQQLIDDFNKGLGQMMRDGSYQKILERFGFTSKLVESEGRKR